MKFLIDENLSPLLAIMACEAGYVQSAHVGHRGMIAWKDNKIMNRILEENWTLVTNNAGDFRPKQGSSSQKPCYTGVLLHAGLVCLNVPYMSTIIEQKLYFESCLEYISRIDNLINKIIEVDPHDKFPGEVECFMHDYPIVRGERRT